MSAVAGGRPDGARTPDLTGESLGRAASPAPRMRSGAPQECGLWCGPSRWNGARSAPGAQLDGLARPGGGIHAPPPRRVSRPAPRARPAGCRRGSCRRATRRARARRSARRSRNRRPPGAGRSRRSEPAAKTRTSEPASVACPAASSARTWIDRRASAAGSRLRITKCMPSGRDPVSARSRSPSPSTSAHCTPWSASSAFRFAGVTSTNVVAGVAIQRVFVGHAAGHRAVHVEIEPAVVIDVGGGTGVVAAVDARPDAAARSSKRPCPRLTK